MKLTPGVPRVPTGSSCSGMQGAGLAPAMDSWRRWIPALAVAFTILVWATSFPAIRLTLHQLEPIPLAAARYGIGGVIAAGWLLRGGITPMTWRDLMLCAGCGVVGAGAYSALLNLGALTVTAGAASFLIKTESLWMAALGVMLLGERFSRLAWAGTALSLGGVTLIAMAQPGGIAWGAGAPFVLLAALVSAGGFVFQRRLVERYGARQVAAIVILSAAAGLLPWMPAAGRQLLDASAETWGWVAFLAIMPTTIGQLCWSYALGVYGAARAGTFLYLIAPVATAMAWLLSREAITETTIVGGGLILGGVMMVHARGGSGRKNG